MWSLSILTLILSLYGKATLQGFTTMQMRPAVDIFSATEVQCITQDGTVNVGMVTRVPNTCLAFICLPNGSMDLVACASFGDQSQCNLVPANISMAFPECCERLVCPIITLGADKLLGP